MSRPLRLQLLGALYHITSRGERRNDIYRSDSDRLVWLSLLGETCARFNFAALAYCQMNNHYHILLETTNGGLSRGMCHFNGKYSQYFNRKHNLAGHVFQGRYKSILCQKETYLLELSRYIELNPVRAGMVADPVQWPWSSYRATMALTDGPAWLRSDAVLSHFGANRAAARQAYELFVASGLGQSSPLARVKNQLVLGDDAFCAHSAHPQPDGDLLEINRTQRRAAAMPLHAYFSAFRDPKEAMARAYQSLAYSMPEIARHARVSVKTVSRAIHAFEVSNRVS